MLVASLRNHINLVGKANDMTSERLDQLPPPTVDSTVDAAEMELKCELPMLYRRCLTTIANGGIGPGYGFIGMSNGYPDSHGRAFVDACREMPTFVVGGKVQQIRGMLPLWEWGSGITVCMDVSDPSTRLFVIDEAGLTRSEMTLFDALLRWVNGDELWNIMFESQEVLRPNPFSGGVMKVKRNLTAIGKHVARFGDVSV